MSFLDGAGNDWIEEAGGEPEPPIQEEPAAEAAPAEPEPTPEEPDPEPIPEPQTASEPKAPHMVPYDEMRKYRERAQEAERKLAERAETPAKPQPVPDAYEQPQEFGQHFDQKFDQERFALRAEMSGFRAEQAFGKDTVQAATAWALEQNDPALGLRVRQSAAPVELVVQEYQRSLTLEALAGRSLEDYAQQHAVEKGWIVSPEPTAPSPKPSSPTPPPRSLASRPGSGGVGQTASGDGFGGVFSSTGMGLKRG